jgi:hypothetical protein
LEHRITLPLHVVPINIKLGGDWVPPILENCEIPVGLEIVLDTVVMKLRCPLIRIFTSVDHGLILVPCIVSWAARVTTIHSSKSVLIVRLEWTLNLLNNATFPCFSHNLSFDRVHNFHNISGRASVGFPSCAPWMRLNDILFFFARAVVVNILLRGRPAGSSLGSHLHEVAKEH